VLIEKASASLDQLSHVIEGASELGERLAEIRYEIEDIAATARDYAEGGGENAEKRLDRIESRLDAIQKLKRKYGGSEEEILAFRDELAEKLDEMENSDELLEKTQKELKLVTSELLHAGEALSNKRERAARELEKLIMNELSFLEMPRVRFVIDLKRQDEPRADGLDAVEFLVSANAGQPPMPMIKIASGGELSRIMLAIKSILLDKDGATSVIFDEIDTGISGKTSRKVGIKLKQIAKKIQVICVTHSAQIASLADNHYLISKHEIEGSAQTQVCLLDGELSVREVARILGGLNVTAAQLSAAREMIEEAKTL
jgi:DNA repair protein RecN (Recombination protein N)